MDLRMPAGTQTCSTERAAVPARETAAPAQVSGDLWMVNSVAAQVTRSKRSVLWEKVNFTAKITVSILLSCLPTCDPINSPV